MFICHTFPCLLLGFLAVIVGVYIVAATHAYSPEVVKVALNSCPPITTFPLSSKHILSPQKDIDKQLLHMDLLDTS